MEPFMLLLGCLTVFAINLFANSLNTGLHFLHDTQCVRHSRAYLE